MKGRRLLWLMLVVIVALVPGTALATSPAESPAPAIYYLGPEDEVRQALALIPGASFVSSLQLAQVVVINDAPLSSTEAQAIAEAVREGKGLVLIMGPGITEASLQALWGKGASWTREEEAQTLKAIPGREEPLVAQINWHSAPQVRERARLRGISLTPLVVALEDEEVVLGSARVGQGRVYVIAAWLSGEHNPQFKDWPYFNYLLYHLTVRAAGEEPLSYADYPASPVPHAAERRAILLIILLMLGTTVAVFLGVRRYSLRHPEALERLVARTEAYRQVETSAWGEIGFHRPLAGFLVLLAMGLILFIPFMIYQTVLLPRFLLPSAQALGAWYWVIRFFDTFWVLFDWGTSIALVKYFSEYRVDDPGRGFKYVQLFVWWQAITGTIQLGVVALWSAYVGPRTAYAYLAYYFIVHALIQFPGFLRVFQYVLRALQRMDYDQILNILATPPPGTIGLLVIPIQALAVLLMRGWGRGNPVFGEMMGGAFGLGLGLYLTEICFFLVGFWLYRRLGYRARVVFMAHFDGQTLRSALKFGAAVTVAGIFGALGWTVQMFLVERYLLNYAEIMGNWNVAYGLILAYSAVGGLYLGVMPGVSEAYSHSRYELTRYYVAQGFKYGGWFSAFIASSLLAMADRFILGSAGEEFARAAQIVGILVLWGAIQFPAWLADRFQEGTGRPYLMAAMLIMEQTLRILLMFLFLGPLQMWGMILAYMIALPIKDLVAWLINWRLILRFRIYWWQSALAPILAGVVNYLAVRLVGNFLWKGDITTSVLLFFIGILPALPFYSFWNGFFGGWDEEGLRELREATAITAFSTTLKGWWQRMKGLMLPLRIPLMVLASPIMLLLAIPWIIYWPTYLGARISPLHARFPIPAAEALTEAKSLTLEKVALA